MAAFLKSADGLDDQQTNLALDQLKQIMLLGAGGGMALRGAQGMMHMFNRNAETPSPSAVAPNTLTIKVPKKETKVAAGVPGSWDSKWWAMPAHLAGGIGAGAAGYKLVDYLIDSQRSKGLKEEVNKAKTDFEKTLVNPDGSKVAEDKYSKMAKQLDEIFEAVEKTADWKNFLGGISATVALPVLLGSGYLGHRLAKSHNKSEVLEAAVKERQRRMSPMSPMVMIQREGE